MLEAPTLEPTVIEDTKTKEEQPCQSTLHGKSPHHTGPGFYWVITGHACFFKNFGSGTLVLLCKSSVDRLLRQGEMVAATYPDGKGRCPSCMGLVTLADIFTIIGTVND